MTVTKVVIDVPQIISARQAETIRSLSLAGRSLIQTFSAIPGLWRSKGTIMKSIAIKWKLITITQVKYRAKVRKIKGEREREEQTSSLPATKVQMRVIAPSPPLAVKIWVRSVERLFTVLSLQTSFEKVVDNNGFHQGLPVWEGIRFVLVATNNNQVKWYKLLSFCSKVIDRWIKAKVNWKV